MIGQYPNSPLFPELEPCGSSPRIFSPSLDEFALFGSTIQRHHEWAAFRDLLIGKFKRCAMCGTQYFLEVHHIVSFEDEPELELIESNCMVLCRRGPLGNCHFLRGHGGRSWRHNLADPWREIEIERAFILSRKSRAIAHKGVIE